MTSYACKFNTRKKKQWHYHKQLCRTATGLSIFLFILELSRNLFVVGMERSTTSPGESKQGMIASYFHFKLKGNLFSFNSHKKVIIFLLLRFLCNGAGLTNPNPSAVLGCQGCRGERPGARAASGGWRRGHISSN